MMIGIRKEEGRVCTVPLHVIKKGPTPSESYPGFEPGLPRQNDIALPLVPPPFPWLQPSLVTGKKELNCWEKCNMQFPVPCGLEVI